MKRCARCKEKKPFDQFGKRAASPDGLQEACKACRNKAEAERRERPEVKAKSAELKATPKYREANAKRGRDRRKANPGCDSPAAMKWVANHPEERASYLAKRKADPDIVVQDSEYQAGYYQEHAEKKRVASAQTRVDKAEELKEKRKQKRINDPLVRERDRGHKALRKARKLGVPRCPYTDEQLATKVAYWGNRCWVCHGPWTAVDHYKPLAKGGAHMLCNFRPICTRCNSAKGSKWPVPPREEIMRWRLLREQTD